MGGGDSNPRRFTVTSGYGDHIHAYVVFPPLATKLPQQILRVRAMGLEPTWPLSTAWTKLREEILSTKRRVYLFRHARKGVFHLASPSSERAPAAQYAAYHMVVLLSH